jgi:hypothetical protein
MLLSIVVLLVGVATAQVQTPRPPLTLQDKIKKLYSATNCQNCDEQCTGAGMSMTPILICDRGSVTNINLSNRGLAGSIDKIVEALSEFKDTVQYIDLRNNKYTGDLTTVTFKDFSKLMTLDLSDNFWHGTWTPGPGVRTPFSLLICVIQQPNEPGCVVCGPSSGEALMACICVTSTAVSCVTPTTSKATTATIVSRTPPSFVMMAPTTTSARATTTTTSTTTTRTSSVATNIGVTTTATTNSATTTVSANGTANETASDLTTSAAMVDTATTAAGGGLGTGEIVGIVLGSLGVLTLIALVVIFVGRRRRREPMLENPNLTPTPTMRDANYGSSGLHQLK